MFLSLHAHIPIHLSTHEWIKKKLFAYCVFTNIRSVNASGPMCTHLMFFKGHTVGVVFLLPLGVQRSNSSCKTWFGNKCLCSLSHLASSGFFICFETVSHYVTHRDLPASTSQVLRIKVCDTMTSGFLFLRRAFPVLPGWSWTLRLKQYCVFFSHMEMDRKE